MQHIAGCMAMCFPLSSREGEYVLRSNLPRTYDFQSSRPLSGLRIGTSERLAKHYWVVDLVNLLYADNGVLLPEYPIGWKQISRGLIGVLIADDSRNH
jgi:hypothetical protein